MYLVIHPEKYLRISINSNLSDTAPSQLAIQVFQLFF